MRICRVKVKGQQVLMHNAELSDPLNPFVKQIAKLTSKRKKSDDDYQKISELEFLGGLYLNEEKKVIIPSKWVKAGLGSAAKNFREGAKCKKGITVLEDALLKFNGSHLSPEELFANGHYRRESLELRGSRVIRTRPSFKNWSAEFEIYYNEQLVDEDMLERWLDTLATLEGLGEGRPNFGRFEVLEIEHSEMRNAAA